MRANIPDIFLLKEYHKYILFKRRGVFSQLKKKNGKPNCVFLGLETILVVGQWFIYYKPIFVRTHPKCHSTVSSVSDEMFHRARLFIIHKFSETSGDYQYFGDGDICHLEVVLN